MAFNLLKSIQYYSYKNQQRCTTEELSKFSLNSEKTGKSYSAYLVLTDDGQKSSYALEFDREKTGA